MLVLMDCPCAYCDLHFVQYSLCFCDGHASFYFHLHINQQRFHQLREPNLDLHNKMKMEWEILKMLVSCWFLKDGMLAKLGQT